MDQKKIDERKCLDVAIRQCLSQHGLSKKIGQLMDGEDIARTREEEPDFLRKPTAKLQKNTKIVGIEHFRIDKLSKQKAAGSQISRGVILGKKMLNTFECGHIEAINGKQISDDAINKILDTATHNIEMQLNANYTTYMQSFRHGFNKHLEKVEKYRVKIRKDTGSRFDFDLIFLLEVHASFPELVFINPQKNKVDKHALPIFEEMIELIEKYCTPSKIEHIVFVFYEDLLKQKARTVAVSAKNIRNDLKKQNIPIYKYLGYPESFFAEFLSNGGAKVNYISEKNKNFCDAHFSINMPGLTQEAYEEFLRQMIPHIIDCEKQKMPYASNNALIQAISDCGLISIS